MQKVISNAIWNAINGSSAAVVAVVVPPFLTRMLTPEAYGAWALALQIGTYVGLFGFGIQIAVGRYVAFHEARRDIVGRDGIVVTAFWFLVAASAVGWLAICGVALAIDRVVPALSAELVGETRWAIVLVGLALAINLPASVFAAVFTGNQRSDVPAKIQGGGRIVLAVGLVLGGFAADLAVLGAIYAAVSLLTVALLWHAWRTRTDAPTLSIGRAGRAYGRELAGFCFSLTIWNFSMLLVGGLDLMIVGRWDYAATPYFAVCVTLVTLVTGTLTSLANALIPAAAAIDEQNIAAQRDLLVRSSRVITAIALIAGFPLIFGSYWVLLVWLGGTYAANAATMLTILSGAAIARNALVPYVTIAIGTGHQRRLTFTPLAEGLVSVLVAVLLVQSLGAVGVALAKIVGAITGISLLVTQHPMRQAVGMSRVNLAKECLMYPALAAAVPIACYVILSGVIDQDYQLFSAAAATTIGVVSALMIGLSAGDRQYLIRLVSARLRRSDRRSS